MTTREVVESFWSAMTTNDWQRAAAHLADDCVVDWPCSGERISREHFAEIQARYPAAAEWRFDLHRLIVEGDVAVTELTVTDGERSARAIVFSDPPSRVLARGLRATRLASRPGRATTETPGSVWRRTSPTDLIPHRQALDCGPAHQ